MSTQQVRHPCHLVNKMTFTSLSRQVAFMDLSELDEFVKAINTVQGCKTAGCEGELAPVQVRSIRLGGALSVAYACNGCALQCVVFETSFLPKCGGSEIGTSDLCTGGCPPSNACTPL